MFSRDAWAGGTSLQLVNRQDLRTQFILKRSIRLNYLGKILYNLHDGFPNAKFGEQEIIACADRVMYD